MKELVSVIVPIFNTEDFLEECLSSIVCQSYNHIEIILIDDGSSDSSSEICDNWAVKDKRIIVIHKKNEGVSQARNKGLEIAKGDFIYFCDSDDVLNEKLIERLVELQANNMNALVGCDFSKFTVAEEILRNSSYVTDNMILLNKRDLFEFILKDGYLWDKLFVKSIVQENNIKFNTELTIFEDRLFIIDYFRHINFAVICNDKLYNYRVRNSSAVNTKNEKNAISTLLARYYTYKTAQEIFRDETINCMNWNDTYLQLLQLKKNILLKKLIVSSNGLETIVQVQAELEKCKYQKVGWRIKDYLYCFLDKL